MNWRSAPILLVALCLTYVIHEGAHWLMGEWLGYDMWMRINSVGLANGTYSKTWHAMAVAAAGPLVTLAQGILAYMWARRLTSLTAFALLFSAFMMRFTAMLISGINPNDEAVVSEWLGLGPWVLHLLVVAVLLFLTARAGLALKLGWRSYVFAYLIVSAGIAAIVFGEPHLPPLNVYA